MDPRRVRPYRQSRLLQTPLGRRLRCPRPRGKKTRALPPADQRQAERFIRTLLERSAYLHPYEHESLRLARSARRSTSTIASVPTAPFKDSRRFRASTTSLGHTTRDPRGDARF